MWLPNTLGNLTSARALGARSAPGKTRPERKEQNANRFIACLSATSRGERARDACLAGETSCRAFGRGGDRLAFSLFYHKRPPHARGASLTAGFPGTDTSS